MARIVRGEGGSGDASAPDKQATGGAVLKRPCTQFLSQFITLGRFGSYECRFVRCHFCSLENKRAIASKGHCVASIIIVIIIIVYKI